MASNEELAWQFFKSQGFTNAGAAGMMGNIQAVSNFISNNLHYAYEKSSGYTDSTYTNAVDNGTYTNFVNDGAGYGLCQWGYPSRKQKLLELVQKKGVSIGDFQTQLEFIIQELTTQAEYTSVLKTLKTTNSILEASKKVFVNYEHFNSGASALSFIAANAQNYYEVFGKPSESVIEPPSNLIKRTSNKRLSNKFNRKIEYIVIHYTAGVTSIAGSAEDQVEEFDESKRQVSADFVVDDETIVLYNPDIKNCFTWHCGGSKDDYPNSKGGRLYGICTNENSIGVEMCSTNSTGQQTQANDRYWSFTEAVINNTIMLVDYLMAAYNIDIDHVIRNYDVNGKLCPGVKGWNADSGSETKWKDFKKRLKKTYEASYAARVANQTIEYHEGPSVSTETLGTYNPNKILTILEERDGWGYTGEGWVLLSGVQQISPSEGIIEHIINNYDSVEIDPNNNKLTYPIEVNEGQELQIHNETLKQLFKLRGKDSNETLNNDAFAKQIIYALENSFGKNVEQCQEKLKLVLKSAYNSKYSLLSTSSKIVVQTGINPLPEPSEKEILKKLTEAKGDIVNYFRKNYNKNGWNENVENAPETLNFWFDFMNTDGEMGKYAVGVIGNRPKAVNDDKVTAIYFQETPSVLFLTPEQYQELLDNREDFNDMTGYTFVQLQPFMENYFTISGQGKSAKDELDSLLYQHIHLTNSVTLTSIPIYHLQPNSRVLVKDDNTGINGEFIVNKITIPLQYNGTTSINAAQAVERIY